MRALEVDLGETYSVYKDNHAPSQHPCTDKRTLLRTKRPVHTSRPVTAESVHAAHIDYGHNAQSVHDNNAQSVHHNYYPTENTGGTCIRRPRQSPMFKCHGENNATFHFCQWCAAPSTYGSRDSDTALLCINEYAIVQRFAQFTKAVAGKPSIRRRDSASLLFVRFLQSRVAGCPAHMVTANFTT